MSSRQFDDEMFRAVLGQYPTGVVIVTAVDADGEPTGMTMGSFSSVSLDPPLVSFMPSKTSGSWAALQRAGTRFCINVLGAHQEGVCRAVATRKTHKFEDIVWQPTDRGNPVIEGSVAYFDCDTYAVHDAGDHHIVVGEVESMGLVNSVAPLIFYRGGYGEFTSGAISSHDRDLVHFLHDIDLARPCMERLADELDMEVTAIVRTGDEVAVIAAAGHSDGTVAPTRVGYRLPYMPPVGSVFAAANDVELNAWVARLGDRDDETTKEAEELALRVRADGLALAMGDTSLVMERLANDMRQELDSMSQAARAEAFDRLRGRYYPAPGSSVGASRLHHMTMPVKRDGGVAFGLTVWGTDAPMSEQDVASIALKLREMCDEVEQRIA